MIIKVQKPLRDNIIINLALVLPFLIIFAILSGVLAAVILNRLDLLIRGSIVAVPGIFAAITLSYIYKNSNERKEHSSGLLNFSEKNCIKLYCIFYLSSLIILFMSPTRPLEYLIIILILYFVIFIQIFTKSSSSHMVLFEIFLLLLNLIYSVTLKYPLYFGGTDILPHMFLSEVTFLSGHTIPMDLSSAYANFPLFHIFISEVSYLLGSSIQSSYFLITAPAFAISVFFVYLVMINISNDKRVSLLSSLLFSTFSVTIYSGMYMVTRTMAFIGFIVILYLIYNRNSKHSPLLKILGLLFGMFIILVHQVSIPQIIVIFFLILFVEIVLGKIMQDKSSYISKTYVLLLIVSFIAYWLFVSYAFTQSLTAMYFDSTNYESLSMKPTIQAGNQWSFIFNNIGYSVVTFLALVGIGGTWYVHQKSYLQVFALISLLILPLYIPTPLQLFWNTMTFFRFDRFILLVSPFIAFMMALGLTYLMELLQSKKVSKNYFYTISLLLLSVLVVSSIISTSPEPNYSIDSERRYFDSAEVACFNHILEYVPYGSQLYSDYFTRRYIPFQKFSQTESLGLPYYNNSFRTSLSVRNIQRNSGYIVWRNKAFLESGLRVGDGGMVDIISDIPEWDRMNSEFEKRNKLYSNSHAEVFY
ncbi:hypothetical protein [Methanolobus halotolerans]|uniref:DUF2206 domain-containing protein n=1 Tax=Methanolobus halotolerans TaxID=2052935 RepID=A0A4E0PTS2_9EURY|nr:hypothetical protein [Methanolobus halotolerans]TGC08297.1 hypothetical protein CUN85_09460 [Methanolobus halotolerans]